LEGRKDAIQGRKERRTEGREGSKLRKAGHEGSVQREDLKGSEGSKGREGHKGKEGSKGKEGMAKTPI
jgi:hypothetical protein